MAADADEERGPVALALALFVLSGFLEIGGGWLVWQTLREKRNGAFAVAGAVLLVLYGVVPCYQPETSGGFGRVYAVYGGFFVALSYLWAWAVDGTRPDVGDVVGATVAIAGVLTALLWPRRALVPDGVGGAGDEVLAPVVNPLAVHHRGETV